MLLVLLMMTLPILSQNISKDSVTIAKPTFKNIVKEAKKCEALRLAYNDQLVSFESLITTNITMFEEIEDERTKRFAAEDKLDHVIDENLKLAKKRKRKPIIIVGVAVLSFAAGVWVAK